MTDFVAAKASNFLSMDEDISGQFRRCGIPAKVLIKTDFSTDLYGCLWLTELLRTKAIRCSQKEKFSLQAHEFPAHFFGQHAICGVQKKEGLVMDFCAEYLLARQLISSR